MSMPGFERKIRKKNVTRSKVVASTNYAIPYVLLSCCLLSW